MNTQKIVVVLLVVAILFSILSITVAFTLSSIGKGSTIASTSPPVVSQPASEVRLTVNPPGTGP